MKMKLTDEEQVLFNENANFPYYIVSKYYTQLKNMPSCVDIEDLFQQANIGLCKAVRGFKEDKGYKFASFAATVIHNELKMYIRKFRTDGRTFVVTSLEAPIAGDTGELLFLQDVLSSDYDLADDVCGKVQTDGAYQKFSKGLTDREKAILQGLMEGRNQYQISQDIGISQSYISRIILRLKEKMHILLNK